MIRFFRHEWWFLLLLFINAVIVLLYALWNLFRRKQKSAGFTFRCAVMLLCPIIGICYFFFGWLYFRLFFRKPVDLEDVIFSKDRVKTYLKADEDNERNFVPLEEAIAVTDTTSTRMLMLEVVRRDIGQSLASISLALNSEDSEVSHYAASVLRETLSRLDADFHRLFERVNELEEEISEYDKEDEPLRTAQGQLAARLLYPERYPTVEESQPTEEEDSEQESDEGEASDADQDEKKSLLQTLSETDLYCRLRDKFISLIPIRVRSFIAQERKIHAATKARRKEKKQEKVAAKMTPEGDLEDSNYTQTARDDSSLEFYHEDKLRERTKRQAHLQGLLARDGAPQEDTSIEAKLAEEIACAGELVEGMHDLLRQKVVSDLEHRRHLDMMQKMGEIIELRDMISPQQFEALFSEHLACKNYDLCRHYCDMADRLYPALLPSYVCRLRLAYVTSDQETFFATLDALKRSRIVIDHETMKLIRAFM